MRNREEGLTRSQSPMGGTPDVAPSNTLASRGYFVPNARDNVIDSLVNAYNSKAYNNPYAPILHRYSDQVPMTALDGTTFASDQINAYGRNGQRLGFVGRDVDPNGVTYRAAHDLGDVNRGYSENTLNTPLGQLGYGYDGETDYGHFTPNDRTANYIKALSNLLYR